MREINGRSRRKETNLIGGRSLRDEKRRAHDVTHLGVVIETYIDGGAAP